MSSQVDARPTPTTHPLTAYVSRTLAARSAAGPGAWEVDGTLVVADVAGFTRLTERLARHGRLGAEEILGTISYVFTELLDATAPHGGDVLKFSGDALVVLFDGPDHAHRACHAALTMQRQLRRLAPPTSVGRTRLRMSIGVHSDRFLLACCGDDHLELFLVGSAVTTAVTLQGRAGAGETLISPATAAALPGSELGPRLADAIPLLDLGQPPAVTRLDPPSTPRLERCVAPPLRRRLVDDGLEHEHRPATMAFIGFGGTDTLADAHGGRDAFDRLQTLATAAMAALSEHEVLLTAVDLDVDGGRLLLTSGVPDAVIDEQARMLRAVLRIVGTDCGLPLRAGVNAGYVFAGPVGTPRRRTYAAMGLATNLAARVSTRAGWGQVLVTRAVTDPVASRLRTVPVPPFKVKGARTPVEAAVVEAIDRGTGREVTQSATAQPVAPLLGRDHQLDRLIAAHRDALDGHGRALELVGPVGSGRSRLLAEVARRTAGAAWFTFHCDPYERTSPYHVARSVLRRLLDVPAAADAGAAGEALRTTVRAHAPTLEPWLPLLAAPLGAEVRTSRQSQEVADRYRRARTQDLICELLAAVPPTPLVLTLEDAENTDDASADLLAAVLARVVPARPWLVIVTRTAAQVGLHPGRGYDTDTVALDPLDDDSARRLASSLAERWPVPPHALPELVERAGGNPLFLTGLVAAHADGAGELPPSIEALIATRIDRLDTDDRRALRYLSVLGARFSQQLVDDVLGELGIRSDQHERWQRLDAFITREEGGFAFRNSLVRQVAYGGLSFRRRRELHGRTADASTADPERAAQLPLHLTGAGRWQQAWETAVAAADRARTDAANAVAGELYAMALHAARQLRPRPPELGEVATRAGDVWDRAGVWSEAMAAYRIAAAVSTDTWQRSLVTIRRAHVHERAGRYTAALRLYSQVRTAAARTDPSQERDRCLAHAHVGSAGVRLAQGRAAASIEHALAALEPAQRSGDTELLARAYHLLHRGHVSEGRAADAAAYLDRALPLLAELGELPAQGTVLYDLGVHAREQGRGQEAIWLFEQSLDVRHRAGDVVRAAGSANALGEVLLGLGRVDDAEVYFADALRVWRGARFPRGVSVAACNLGVVAVGRGDIDRALPLLEEAAELATGLDDRVLAARTALWRARALLASDRVVEAFEQATIALESETTAADAHLVRADALERTGGHERAAREREAAARQDAGPNHPPLSLGG